YVVRERRWVGDTRVSASGSQWHHSRPHSFTDAYAALGGSPNSDDDRAHGRSRSTDPVERPPIPRPHGFLDRVAELVPLRHDGARIAEIVDDPGALPYLRVVCRDEGVITSWPVGISERGVDSALVESFAQVHRR